MELENMQIVDGTRPRNRLSLEKPGKWLGFDTKFDTNLGQGLIVADRPYCSVQQENLLNQR